MPKKPWKFIKKPGVKKFMIIGIDANEANVETRVGVHQYAFEVLWGIYKILKGRSLKSNNGEPITKVVAYLKKSPLKDLPTPTNFFKYRVLPGEGVWILKKLTPDLLFSKSKPDIFFSPSHYLPPFATMPMVCTIHDLGYLKFSEQFKKHDFWQLKYWSAISIIISKYIIAVSKTTGDDIVRHYHYASKKIKVVQHGYDSTRFNTNISENDVRRVLEKYSIVRDYILFIGTLKPSKNIEGILEAFKLISSFKPQGKLVNQNKKLKLVIAGKKGWLYDLIFLKVKELGLEGSVIFTDYVDEKDKPALIKGARVFMIPSFWEGFGMDVLNAFACGVPVVASNTGALPEITGDAAIKVDPYSPKDIASGVLKVLSMPRKQYNNLVNKGFERVKSFSWDKCAEKTLGIFESTT